MGLGRPRAVAILHTSPVEVCAPRVRAAVGGAGRGVPELRAISAAGTSACSQRAGQGPETAAAQDAAPLREAWSSGSRAKCEWRRDGLVRWLEAHAPNGRPLRRCCATGTDFGTLCDFPAEHWSTCAPRNPIESLFPDHGPRTDVAKRKRRGRTR